MSSYKEKIRKLKEEKQELINKYLHESDNMYLKRLEHKHNTLTRKRNQANKKYKKYYQKQIDDNQIAITYERARQQHKKEKDYENQVIQKEREIERTQKSHIMRIALIPIIIFIGIGIALNVISGLKDFTIDENGNKHYEIVSTPIDKIRSFAKLISDNGQEYRDTIQDIRNALEEGQEQFEGRKAPLREDYETWAAYMKDWQAYYHGTGKYAIDYSNYYKSILKGFWLIIKTPIQLITEGAKIILA